MSLPWDCRKNLLEYSLIGTDILLSVLALSVRI